jgi:hydroxyacylglutathione hydrolase
MSRDEFIKAITEGLTPPPAYFFSDAMINKQGYDTIDSVVEKNKKALSPEQVEAAVRDGALILDTRNPEVFEKGFVKGSLNIGLGGMYAIWVGTLVDINQPLVLVTEPGKEEESIIRLARVGYEKISGYLDGGFNTWKNAGKPIDTVTSITYEEFAKRVNENQGKVLDVRRETEFVAGHVKDASLIPLAELGQNFETVDKKEPVMIHCASGYRSVVAASLLQQKGYSNVINVHGGWNKIKTTDVPVETGLPSNMVAD